MLSGPLAKRVIVGKVIDSSRIPVSARCALVDEQADLDEFEEPVQSVVALIPHVVGCLGDPYPEDDDEKGEKDGDGLGIGELVLLKIRRARMNRCV
jgi:hypothetical protein